MDDHGISDADADKEIERELSLDFANKAEQYHTVYADLLTFSFGRVEKAPAGGRTQDDP
jgi:hypothetical protein